MPQMFVQNDVSHQSPVAAILGVLTGFSVAKCCEGRFDTIEVVEDFGGLSVNASVDKEYRHVGGPRVRGTCKLCDGECIFAKHAALRPTMMSLASLGIP